MNKHQIALGTLIVVASLLTSACASETASALVTVRNGTSEPIVSIVIDGSNQTVRASEVPVGNAVTLTYAADAESDYHVVARLKSGRTIEKTVGYVDPGLNKHDLIIIRDTDVEFRAVQTQPDAEGTSLLLPAKAATFTYDRVGNDLVMRRLAEAGRAR